MSWTRVGVVALAVALGALGPADAGVLTFATPISSFVPDSRAAAGATGAAFLAATGGYAIDFSTAFDTDRFGGPLPLIPEVCIKASIGIMAFAGMPERGNFL